MAIHTSPVTVATQEPSELLHRLLAQGDSVSIERGQLVIHPASGKPVPANWMAQHNLTLTLQILSAVGVDAYLYRSHATGRYGRHKQGGLTLQFQSVIGRADAYTIFNVELTRARDTAAGKKGSPLPAGQFRISKDYQLYHFWQATCLPMPRRLSALHDYMGKLKGILFTASLTAYRTDARLDTRTLLALNIPAPVVRLAVLPDNSRTIVGQGPDNSRTRTSDKEIAPTQQPCGLRSFSGTGENTHGKTVIRNHGHTVASFPQSSRKPPQEQTVDEWLADYDSPSASA
ncbi:hypothetical protein [Pseudomonas benzenivorans]|uniref:Uncharacterized protein n=1 Tax=Pseudomonas benzenivorans TaxID=556533 RepID=A0ABY5H6C9_9PSED|nr:hypothetical protein [Pseudomonas benzenivorans]UTW07873.1 hypothetical protein KDW96_00600 [Pseudomonas benzenivorans]